jgi:peptidoglycan hydrolase-like protein with peptidoglycan-binding domain
MATKPEQKDKTTTALEWPAEHLGTTGENVRTVQYLLNEHGATVGVDGMFGRFTTDAIRTFQADHGLTVDGIVGNLTWPELVVEVTFGSNGHAVRAAQRQLNRRSGRVLIDGLFRGKTNTAVGSFQGTLGLHGGGTNDQPKTVDQQTWNALVSDYLTSDDGQAAAIATFRSWRQNDLAAARKDAAHNAVQALFARRWRASDRWVLDACDSFNGLFRCTWTRKEEKLVLVSNDNATAAPYYFVNEVTFEKTTQS